MDEKINNVLKKPLQYVKGVGEARAKLFQKLDIHSVEDMINHFPREYEDRGTLKKIGSLQDNDLCSFEGVILSKVAERRIRRGLAVYKLALEDDTGRATATWFNQSYLKDTFEIGERYVFYGKISRKFNQIEIQNPVFEKVDDREMKNTCRIVPLYPATARLSQNVIRSVVDNALKSVIGKLEESLPAWVKEKFYLSEINYAYQNIHFPGSDEDFKNARFRLVFEELFLLQLGLLSLKHRFWKEKEGIAFGKVEETARFIERLPFKLTEAQKKVYREIAEDMESHGVMNRLVQGDVGSGKTIVAVLALFKAVKNGYQGALMVPTEILAEQHFHSISGLLEGHGIKAGLLTGSQSKAQKEQILEKIKTGEVDVIIGTHALIEDKVLFRRLGLVVTDEQHRFGVRQRTALSQKGDNPDVLVMTATPIPRTLALILYGDLDISVIDQLPPGRKPIKTYSVDEGMRERINAFVRTRVAEGRQVYIVCPLVEDSDAIEARSAVELAERIAREDFEDLKVGMIHGKMAAREKDRVMRSFVAGDISILVSTTVIEVGVNVPNATVMIIENAERFGLAQLHQLRGRVGRGEHQSFCILYNEGKTGIAKERMKIMEKTNDGFVISEKDLELRGPGEFFGTRQHGLPDLKIANLYRDIEILKQSQEAAARLMEDDWDLHKPENLRLRKSIHERFKGKFSNLSLN